MFIQVDQDPRLPCGCQPHQCRVYSGVVEIKGVQAVDTESGCVLSVGDHPVADHKNDRVAKRILRYDSLTVRCKHGVVAACGDMNAR